ncbi:HlyD family efflux transporter periplasmic adaptor subunit [Sphaerospermopsis aphanizomenoides BCCUSP55]|uniref:HlyD family efflux transporter periplasmic adaptor subunit n=1 Tax=Sphaerospermopsis aphanizomenoides TaxID=459663 RepID=UPI001903B6A1|nr:HlyD family efflux transporter periplasmic adaptor subunit [Sphaerospermopsis aphanizomenoides]MBK1988093.1 HlyD family efflux transporter periplasmic adaptor subunit [Sphaerospermopsis aphanizomenoides BCCUSP55]
MNFLRREEKYVINEPQEPDPEQLHLIDVNEFLPQIGKWTNIGGVILVSIFIAGVGLTSVLNYHVTIKVPTSIRPVGDLRVVQSAIAGTIQTIKVKENQVVNQGEVLAYIDNFNLQTQKSQLTNSIQQSQLQFRQMDAQLVEIDTQIAAQVSLINRTIISAQAQLSGTQRNYEDQRIKANSEMEQAQVALQFARSQFERLQKERALKATIEEAEAALRLAIMQRDRLQPIIQSGAISRNLLEEKEQAVRSAEAKLEQAKTNASNLLEEREQSLKVAELNLNKAQIAINPNDANVIIAFEQIQQERAKGNANLAALRKDKEILLQQRIELQKQLIRTRKELEQIDSELNKSVIRSPITGTLLKLNLRNPGQVVQSGEAIAQIAPLDVPMVIKAHVQTQDIDKVEPGQKVVVQVSACPYPDYGTLQASVISVAPDALPTVKNGANPNAPQLVTYEVNIQPQQLYLGKGDRQCHLKAGMEGRASIITREETILQFILRKARLIADI